MLNTRSRKLFARAKRVIPGGVNSPVRAFKAVGGKPLFMARGRGSKIWDADGNQYLDYVCSWGPLILGHAHPQVVKAIVAAARKGTSYGAPTQFEVELAEEICAAIPSVEKVRLVNSGTEATMSAIRLARAYTGRNRIIKFDGCYHGHADFLLVKAGSGVATLSLPDSPGVPSSFAESTISLPYNDIRAVEQAFARNKDSIACVIVEPVAGNMGVVPPSGDFLVALRDLTRAHGALLIFDEVITGFRLRYGGAQQIYGVEPDLTCLGKIIGGGLPVGAYGGRAKIMRLIAPEGPVYQAGTLSGNPLAAAAGLQTLRLLKKSGTYERLEKLSAQLADGIAQAASAAGVKVTINRVGSMLTVFFTDGYVYDYESAKRSDTASYGRFFSLMLKQGIYLPPSQFEAIFVSLAHSGEDILRTIAASRLALKRL